MTAASHVAGLEFWTGPQIPVTVLPAVVRSEAVAREVEVFLPRICAQPASFRLR